MNMPKFNITRPSEARGRAPSVAEQVAKEDLKQLNMRIPADLRLRLKRYALDTNKTVRDVVIELLETLPRV